MLILQIAGGVLLASIALPVVLIGIGIFAWFLGVLLDTFKKDSQVG